MRSAPTLSLSNLKNSSTKSNLSYKKQGTSIQSQATLQSLVIKPGFDKERNSLENKYIDIVHWPVVAAV